MANYSNLKAAIAAAIKANGNQEITGQLLQDVLTSMVSVIGANYTFAGVATPSTNPGTPDQNVVYMASQAGTYTNFGGIQLPAGISLLMWNGAWTSNTVMYGDGGVFDISVYKSSGGTLATFADLAAALDGGNNIPASARNGGMSVKFVQSSDNKYIRYNLIADEFTTDVTKWAIDDEGVYVNNPEFVYVKTDKDNRILWAIKTDGSIYYGAGVPQQVIDYIEEKIAELSLDEYEDIVAFLNGLEEGDKTLQTLLNEKVDKEEGKALIDADYADGVHYFDKIDNFVELVADKNLRIIEGIKDNGQKYLAMPSNQDEIINNKIEEVIENTRDTSTVVLLENIKNKYRYLITTFGAVRSDEKNLTLMGTDDLRNFTTIAKSVFTPTLGQPDSGYTDPLRDPSICQHDGYYYIVYTTSGFEYYINRLPLIGMVRTKDFTHYEELTPLSIDVDVTGYPRFEGYNAIWAPCFTWDERSNQMYIIFNIVKWGYENGVWGHWTHLAYCTYNFTTHTTSRGGIIEPNAFDGHIRYYKGKYYLFGNNFSIYESEHITSGYTTIHTYDINIILRRFGEEGQTLNNLEAPFPILLDDGRWRIYCLAVGTINGSSDLVGNGQRVFFIESKTSDLSGDWYDAEELNYNDAQMPYPCHFTMYDFSKRIF